MPVNFMRHYYDVYCLLEIPEVLSFIGTEAYDQHKIRRFRSSDNRNIAENEAFKVSDAKTREIYKQSYFNTRTLYYRNQPEFEKILDRIQKMAAKL